MSRESEMATLLGRVAVQEKRAAKVDEAASEVFAATEESLGVLEQAAVSAGERMDRLEQRLAVTEQALRETALLMGKKVLEPVAKEASDG